MSISTNTASKIMYGAAGCCAALAVAGIALAAASRHDRRRREQNFYAVIPDEQTTHVEDAQPTNDLSRAHAEVEKPQALDAETTGELAKIVDFESSLSARRAPRHVHKAPTLADRIPKVEQSQVIDFTGAIEVPEVDEGDYADVAEKYVERRTLRERMETRAKGVRATLASRLSSDMMEGVPLIRRADGSVGDVGTTWWNTFVTSENLMTGVDLGGLGVDDTLEETPEGLERRMENSTRAQELTRRVPQVDQGLFPEQQILSKEDVWEQALAALDEELGAPVMVVFQDVVGDADTLDEPDGLEPVTEFIPFRVPGGHPEVVDTGSYVDFLIRDELARNSSSAMRRRAGGKHARRLSAQETHPHLRVIEGGQSSTGLIEVKGKHFKQAVHVEAYRPKHLRPSEVELDELLAKEA